MNNNGEHKSNFAFGRQIYFAILINSFTVNIVDSLVSAIL